MARDKDTTPSTTESTTDVEKLQRLSPDELRSIGSFDDALALLQENLGAEIIGDASHEIGDGFTMLQDKDKLLDVPFIAVGWTFADGDYVDPNTGVKAQYIVMRVVTDKGDKFIIVDGSPHGVCGQMQDYTVRRNAYAGLVVKGGLRKSEYDTTDASGNPIHGTTHYLNV